MMDEQEYRVEYRVRIGRSARFRYFKRTIKATTDWYAQSKATNFAKQRKWQLVSIWAVSFRSVFSL